MSEIRLNSEKSINNPLFKLKVGTVDKVNPRVVYLDGRCFLSPSDVKENYSSDIRELKRDLSNKIRSELLVSEDFNDKFLVNFQIAESGLNKGKKSFLSFQVFLRQKKEMPIPFKTLKHKMENSVNSIITSFEDSIRRHDFIVTKTKK